jgi:Fe-S-cluster containining protein
MSEPWYKEGLRFSCTQCGKCCTGSPGYVWIDESAIAEMAAYLNISAEQFTLLYTRKVGDRLSLKEDPETYDCIFLKGRACRIYEARPKQCRTFPWWKENLESRAAWAEAAKRCEGIGVEEAPLISLAEIKKHL